MIACNRLTVLLLLLDSGWCSQYIFWAKDWTVGVRVLGERSSLHNDQTGSAAHPASYPLDTGQNI
jgi:hypothetical protein